MIEENLEENIGKKEGNDGILDDAEMILDLLLYSDEDLENRVANYNDLDTPVNIGLATDLIRLISWTEFALWIDV